MKVKTICADYFMEAPLHVLSKDRVKVSQKVLGTLIQNSIQLGVTDIVIPCIDQSSLSNNSFTKLFVGDIQSSIELAEQLNINLSLETDLAPAPFLELLKS